MIANAATSEFLRFHPMNRSHFELVTAQTSYLNFCFILTFEFSGGKKSFCADPSCLNVAAITSGSVVAKSGWHAAPDGRWFCFLTQSGVAAAAATGSRKSGGTSADC